MASNRRQHVNKRRSAAPPGQSQSIARNANRRSAPERFHSPGKRDGEGSPDSKLTRHANAGFRLVGVVFDAIVPARNSTTRSTPPNSKFRAKPLFSMVGAQGLEPWTR